MKMLFAINVDWYFDLHWKDRLLSEMAKNFDIHVCYAKTKDRNIDSTLKVSNFPLHRSNITPLNNLTTILSCIKLVRLYTPDIIHSVTIKPNLFFGIIARFKKIPILITIVGLGSIFSSNSFKYRVLQKATLLAYRFIGKGKCHFIFENTDDQKLFFRNNICTTQNSSISPGAGIDLATFKPSLDLEADDGLIRVLFAARLLYGKGLEQLIEAVEQLNKEEVIFRLDVAGIIDNESLEAIPKSQIDKWNQEGKINWLGRCENMPRLLSQVNIVALPTTYSEGLPRILLEAAACSRPTIATDTPGCNNLIKHGYNGLLIQPGNSAQLANALETYKNKDLRVLNGQRSRKIIEERFTTEHVIKSYQKAYQQLLELD